VDVGEARVGVAISDPDGMLAIPLVTLARDRRGNTDVEQLTGLVTEHEATAVVVGLPRSLSGKEGPAARGVRRYAQKLFARIAPIPVHMMDERLTTVEAGRTLSERGVRGRRQRAVVDQAAAVLILQAWLDAERKAETDPDG
jgi:putative holliday junction resolvase